MREPCASNAVVRVHNSGYPDLNKLHIQPLEYFIVSPIKDLRIGDELP